MASHAARSNRQSNPAREMLGIKHKLLDLADAVLEGRQDRANAIVAGQLYHGALRALETERRWHETQEIEGRLDEL